MPLQAHALTLALLLAQSGERPTTPTLTLGQVLRAPAASATLAPASDEGLIVEIPDVSGWKARPEPPPAASPSVADDTVERPRSLVMERLAAPRQRPIPFLENRGLVPPGQAAVAGRARVELPGPFRRVWVRYLFTRVGDAPLVLIHGPGMAEVLPLLPGEWTVRREAFLPGRGEDRFVEVFPAQPIREGEVYAPFSTFMDEDDLLRELGRRDS